MTVEPRVEDLLASIRKAIDDDTASEQGASGPVSAGSTTLNEQGKLMRGSMREMRVSVDPPVARPVRNSDAEIEEIRAKVDRNFAEAMAPKPERVRPDPSEFSSIMSGARRNDPYDAPRPSLRGTISSAMDYEDAPPPRRYREEPPPPAYDAGWEPRPPRGGALMSPRSSYSAQASFEQLAESLMHRMGGDRTVEDITRDLLRGMLRQWLDDNLPPLVERLVREEIERVARRGR